ncbi:dimethyl sulfoxide reductase, anaerobic, subunit A [uncultured delta proteobacterium]|uniref:Dimethyl sulfoxide reductase, anaerobic, subunit A n=1 Tax=uncultured delta proteobacterium TaxID=34034 RepID=A0A212JMK3_9DELT|nr:dimethyl sulfoxide reductase, anaerobic, subunit A [uncultured delta proteobacterium]
MSSNDKETPGMSRRTFLKWSAAGAAAVPFMLYSNPFLELAFAQGGAAGELVIPTASTLDCGGRCLNKVHLVDGVITRISTRTTSELNPDMPVMKGCVRGRGYRKYQYHPDRLKYPMKRVGKRGEGKWARISWDEAIEIIARKTQEITEKYGPDSRFVTVGTGTTGGATVYANLAKRLFNCHGGFLDYYHSVSMGNTAAATMFTYGVSNTGNSMDSVLHSKLIILWGHNPTETIFGHSNYYLNLAKERGCKIIAVDPRYSDSAISYADEWIPLLPNTDSALMDAMAYVIVTENLHDKEFLDKYCLGFDEDHMPEGVPEGESYLTYLMGVKDGVKKTPEWAEGICKVKANTIRQLAREYASAKPAAILSGWGPQRHSSGERTSRGSAMLCCITGNVGKLGGWAGGYGGVSRPFQTTMPSGKNPIKHKINIMQWTDAIEDYTRVSQAEGLVDGEKLNVPIKMLVSIAGNYVMGQNPDLNATRKLLEDESKVEFFLASDLLMTQTCNYADIVLPSTTFFEGWDLASTWNSGAYFILSQKVVQPMFEARHPYDWLTDVAKKLGVEKEFTEGRTQEEWVRFMLDETRKKYPDVPEWEAMKKQGIYYFKYPTMVTFKKQIDDLEANPFPTPSGKIELFSKRLYDRNDPQVPAVAKYVPAWEGPADPLAEKYPFQVIGWKNKQRDNSSFFTHPWLTQVARQVMWINPLDADKKGIRHGDVVRVFNDRGAIVITAEVTERIIPGVLAVPSGGWYNPGPDGVDKSGCLNVLTTMRKTPLAHGNAHHSCLVDIKKA